MRRPDRVVRRRIAARGIAQGVGFRPFVFDLAGVALGVGYAASALAPLAGGW